jgi:hypothetical protein
MEGGERERDRGGARALTTKEKTHMNWSSGSRARTLGRVARAMGCQAPRAVI